MTLIHVGEVIADLRLEVPTLPPRGGDRLASGGGLGPGGGFNVLAAARGHGVACRYGGALGVGPIADLLRSSLMAAGVEVVGPAVLGQDSGCCVALVEADGERTFATLLGAEAHLEASALADLGTDSGDLVYVSGYGLGMPVNGSALAGWVPTLKATVTVVCDPGPLVRAIPAAVLASVAPRIDWWSANGDEAAALSGCSHPAAAAAWLARERPAGGGALVRIGADGCWLAQGRQPPVHLAAPAVTVVDTTGAGDAHVGLFMAALHLGLPAPEAAERATIGAALSVTLRGAATAPDRQTLDAYLGDARR